MIEFQAGSERYKLGFNEEVRKAYQFLINDFGFSLVKDDITFVRYESKEVFINLYHGRGSYELGFQIGLINKMGKDKEVYYTIKDIIDYNENNNFKPFQTSNAEGVKKFVLVMAELVKKYCIKALDGDRLFLKKLDKFCSENFQREMIEMDLRRILPEADKAWRNKNYSKYSELMEPIASYVSSSEKMKLQFVKKHKKK